MATKSFKAVIFSKTPAILKELVKRDYSFEKKEGTFNLKTRTTNTVYHYTEIFVDKPTGTGSVSRIAYLLKNKFFAF